MSLTQISIRNWIYEVYYGGEKNGTLIGVPFAQLFIEKFAICADKYWANAIFALYC